MNAIEHKPQLKWWDAVLAVPGILCVVAAWLSGIATNVVNIFLIAYLPVAIGTYGWAAFKGKLHTDFVRRPFAPEHRWFVVQLLVRWAFVLVWALVLRASIIPLQLGDDITSLWSLLIFILFLIALFPLLPKKRILASRLVLVVGVTLFFGVQLVMASVPPSASEVTTMDVPLRTEVLVFQGGASPLLNHHFLLDAQRHALDVVALKNGKLSDGAETELSSHGCFGQPIYAPLHGTIVKVVNDRPDMAYGKTDHEQIVGNHVVLQVAPERFVLFAHLKQGSVQVHAGERVECGKVLAQCGNSGNTSAPHLHLQVQNRAEFTAPDLRTYPIAFRNAVVVRGSKSLKDPTVLRRNDRVRSTGTICR